MNGSNILPNREYPPKPVVVPGLPVAVILLRNQGRRITKRQMDEASPIFGRLKIENLLDEIHVQGRMRATLGKPDVTMLGNVHKPLFNPVIERADHTGFVLSGYEIDSIDGEAVQYVQAWWVRPLP